MVIGKTRETVQKRAKMDKIKPSKGENPEQHLTHNPTTTWTKQESAPSAEQK